MMIYLLSLYKRKAFNYAENVLTTVMTLLSVFIQVRIKAILIYSISLIHPLLTNKIIGIYS